MKPQLDVLQSFDPGERAEAGRELVEMGLTRTAHALLDHVVNEFDDRVLAAIASAVRAAPIEDDESRRARELRQWAVSELDRLRLEDAFMGGTAPSEPPAAPVAPTTAAQVQEIRGELPIRVPAPAPAAALGTTWTPAPSAPPVETPPPPAVPGTSWVAPTGWVPETTTPTPTRRRSLPYISWRAPLELTEMTSAPSAGAARTRLPAPAPEPIAPPADEVRFESPEPAPTPPDGNAEAPPSSVGLTLAERLKARAG